MLLDNTTTNPNGIFGGGQIGFNWQFSPNWLIGVEADGSVSDINTTGTNCSATGCARSSGKIEDFGTVRGLLGYVFNNVLLYGMGGWAWSHSNVDRTITCVVAGGGVCPWRAQPISFDRSDCIGLLVDHSGWVAGAGIEWMFAPNWTAKVEYQHLEFDNVTRDFNYPGFPAAFRHVVSDVRIDTVRVGVNYIFGDRLSRSTDQILFKELRKPRRNPGLFC